MTDPNKKASHRPPIDEAYADAFDDPDNELDTTDERPALNPERSFAGFDREARTVIIDGQAAAMEYAVASSLNPDIKLSVPPEGEKRPSQEGSIRVYKGRMSEPPPIGRRSEPIKIVKGSKISD